MRGDKKIAASDMQLATTWLGWQDSTRQALSLATIFMSLLLRKRWTIGSNPAEKLNKKQQTQNCVCCFWLGWQNPTRQALSLATIFMSLLLRKRWTIGSNPAEKLNKKQQTQNCVCCFWLGWQDSNLRMQQSKCCVLPLDDTPILSLLSILIFQNILIL